MRRPFQSLFSRSGIRFGLASDSRGRLRDPRFASFIGQCNRRSIDTHVQDALLRGRKLLKKGLIVLVAAGGAWVVIESAKALSMF